MRTPHMILLLAAAALWAASHAHAATPGARAAWQQARDVADANYKNARARCDVLAGNPKDLCVADAKAVRVHEQESARARYDDTLKAYTRARMRIAAANYDRDKVRCAGFTGNEKDVCQAQAKAMLVSAQADAKADSKTIEARNEAREDKLEAAWKVARERCDAFAGAAKDQCLASAKAEFGK
jgi:hypothetical protein